MSITKLRFTIHTATSAVGVMFLSVADSVVEIVQ